MLDPVNRIGHLLCYDRVQFLAKHAYLFRHRLQFGNLLLVFESGQHGFEAQRQFAQRRSQIVFHDSRLMHPAVVAAVMALPFDAAIEKSVHPLMYFYDGLNRIVDVSAVRAQKSLAAFGVVKRAKLIPEPVLGDVQAEMAGGDILDGVGLVENGDVIFRQIIHARNPKGQIGKE